MSMNIALTYCNSEIAKRRKQVECALCTGTEMTANATNRRLNSCRQSCHFANKHWFLLAHLSPLSPLKLFLSPPLLTGRPSRFPGYFHRLIFTSLLTIPFHRTIQLRTIRTMADSRVCPLLLTIFVFLPRLKAWHI